MIDAKAIAELGGLLAGGGATGVGAKIIWDWLKNRPGGNGNPGPQKASNGFITLKYLNAHCKGVQESCAKVIGLSLKSELGPILERLKSGDKLMERTDKILTRHEEKFAELDKG